MAFASSPIYENLSFDVVHSAEPLLTQAREEFSEARQHRIIEHAKAYLQFRAPPILTASLRGPLTDDWARSWYPDDCHAKGAFEHRRAKLRMRIQTDPKRFSKRLRTNKKQKSHRMTTSKPDPHPETGPETRLQQLQLPQILQMSEKLSQTTLEQPSAEIPLDLNESLEFEYKKTRRRPRAVTFETPEQVAKHARTVPARENSGSLRTYFNRVSASAAKRGGSRLADGQPGDKHDPRTREVQIGWFDETGQATRSPQEATDVPVDESTASEGGESAAAECTEIALLQATRAFQSELDSPGSDQTPLMHSMPAVSAHSRHRKSLRDIPVALMSTQELLDAPPDFSLSTDQSTPRAEALTRPAASGLSDSGPLNTSELSIPRTHTGSSTGNWAASSPAPGSSQGASIDRHHHVDIPGALDAAEAFLGSWRMEAGGGSSQVSVHG